MIIFKDEIANEEKVIPKSAKPGDCDIYAFDADSDVEETASNEIEEREVMKEETVVETKTSFLSKELKFASKKRNNSILEDSVLNPRRKLCADNEISTTLPVGKENQSVVLKKVADLFSTKTLNKNNVVETKQIQKTGGKLSLNNKASKLSTNSGKVSKITSFFSQNK